MSTEKTSHASKEHQLKEADVKRMLVATTHLGVRNIDRRMQFYIFDRQKDGTFVFNLQKVWAKIVFAARIWSPSMTLLRLLWSPTDPTLSVPFSSSASTPTRLPSQAALSQVILPIA